MIFGQIFKGTLSNLTGVALGILSNIWLFPLVFSLEELGVYRWVERMSSLLMVIALFGLHRTYVRFQSQFTGYLARLFLSNTLSIILILAIIFALIFSNYTNQFSYIFNMEYFPEMDVLGLVIFGSILYNFGLSVSSTNKKIAFPFLIKNVGVRMALIIGVLFVYLGIFSFLEWMYLLAAIHLVVGISVLSYGMYQKKTTLVKPKIREFLTRKEFLAFSSSGVVMGVLTMSMSTLDSQIIVTKIGFEALGVYSLAYFIGNLVESVRRPVSVSLTPIIAECWNEENYDRIHKIYKETSKILTAIVMAAAIFIIPNLEFLYGLIPDSQRFEGSSSLVLLILLTRLIDYSFGVNSEILSNGPYYRFNVGVTFLFVVSMVILCFLLIPIYGLKGVAITGIISYLIFNLVRSIYIYLKIRIFPFTKLHVKILGYGLVILGYSVLLEPTEIFNLFLMNIVNAGLIGFLYFFHKDELVFTANG